MSNKSQLQENNSTLEFVIEQLESMPTTEDCMQRIDELEDEKAITFVKTLQVSNTGWTLDGDMYKKTISCAELLSTDTPIIDVVTNNSLDDNKLFIAAWSRIIRAVTTNGNIVLYAKKVPDVSFSFYVKVVR